MDYLIINKIIFKLIQEVDKHIPKFLFCTNSNIPYPSVTEYHRDNIKMQES